MKHPNLRHYSTEKISHRVLYALTAVTTVVFCLFYFVDFDHPFYDNPEYNAPKFTGLLIGFIVFFVAASVLTGFVALAVSIRKNGRAGGVVNGIHTARITSAIVAFTALLLIITFVLGSDASIYINGEKYQDAFWLKTADMFVSSIIVMLSLSVAAVVYGTTRYFRKKDNKC